jgi:hypothetical protein
MRIVEERGQKESFCLPESVECHKRCEFERFFNSWVEKSIINLKLIMESSRFKNNSIQFCEN